MRIRSKTATPMLRMTALSRIKKLSSPKVNESHECVTLAANPIMKDATATFPHVVRIRLRSSPPMRRLSSVRSANALTSAAIEVPRANPS